MVRGVREEYDAGFQAERHEQTILLHDMIGNVHGTSAFDRRFMTMDVALLAIAIYDDRAFDAMPLLADALEEAGGADSDILAHCRGGAPHARGCWVLDALLGRR
jgi:hypothetical protein